jgi:hypothetical protein
MSVLQTKPQAIVKTDREGLYKASAREAEFVQVPEMSLLMIDGRGDPNTAQEYKDAIGALYGLSYALKFALKKEIGLDRRVGQLEGLFWAKNMAEFGDRKADWLWGHSGTSSAWVTDDPLLMRGHLAGPRAYSSTAVGSTPRWPLYFLAGLAVGVLALRVEPRGRAAPDRSSPVALKRPQ